MIQIIHHEAEGTLYSAHKNFMFEQAMRRIIEFGEQINGYQVRVLNERAVRASAGLLFLAAFIAFMNVLNDMKLRISTEEKV